MHKCNRLLRLIMAIIILPLTGCSGGGTSRIEYLQFSPGGKWLVAAGGVWLRSGEIKVWECSSWKLYADWTNSLSDQIQNGRFASDEEFVSIGGKMDTKDKRKYGGNEIRFWNISDKREIQMFDLRNARGFAKQIDYLAAKEMVVFGQLSKGGAAAVCSLPALHNEIEFAKDLGFTAYFRFSPDGSKILCCNRRQISLFDASSGKLIAERRLDDAEDESDGSGIRFAAFSPKGNMIAIGSRQPEVIYVIPSDLGKAIQTLNVGSGDYAAFTPDNEMIAVSRGRAIEVISIKENKGIRRFENKESSASIWSFSPSGSRIAIAEGWHIRILDTETGTTIAELSN